MAAEDSTRTKVFRLRGVPRHLDRQGLAELICRFIPDGNPSDIFIASLASGSEFWSSGSKTATLTFKRLPEAVAATPSARAWRLPVPGLPGPLILDDSFQGLTQLNDVLEDQHRHDCIIISGLASHPMGSWQPRGPDKSFMWIRDALPPLGVRFMLYGYDTVLVGSKSFQRVDDLAMSLINALKAGGWTSPGAKPLIFLAHSLGGVVLKQMFVMLAGSGTAEVALLAKTKGAIFFGVPSQGMRVTDMTIMLGEQPNKDALVKDLSDDSLFLAQLERQFSGISYVRRMRLFWCYETQMTATLVQVNGRYERSGQETILVSKHSATGGRCDSDPASTVQVDANHSDIVKLSPGHHLINIMADKLGDIINSDAEPVRTMHEVLDPGIEPSLSLPSSRSIAKAMDQFQDPWLDPEFWDKSLIAQSLRSPERDNRLHQIDPRAGKSFEWAFSKPSIGLTTWLQGGKGLFWIRGRPASGKSTMMKFLYNDSRTWQLAEGWRSETRPVRAAFFFHHRGSAAQKSFEGLVRSILGQFLDDKSGTLVPLLPMFRDRYQNLLDTNGLGSFKTDLAYIVGVAGIKVDSQSKGIIADIMECQFPLKKLREIVKAPMLSVKGTDTIWHSIEEAAKQSAFGVPRCSVSTLEEKLRAIEPPVYRLDWDKQTKAQLLRLIEDWRKAMDLREKLQDLISLRDPEAQDHMSKQAEDLINWAVERHRRREGHRFQVQSEDWSMPKLRQAFNMILEQRNTSLALFLFLDALDEYDGPTEIIAGFIQDLVADRPHSRTRIQILFSSRPWTVFLDTFATCPGFEIHKHTDNDIRELCAQMIQPNMPGFGELKRLIGDIVSRARGVFLWVKLLIHDLSRLAAECELAGKNTAGLRKELVYKLKSLPVDLVDYYGAIIERIPPSCRLETYCLLETLCRADMPPVIHQVPDILACSTISNYSHIKITGTTQQSIYSLDEHAEVETRVREISGGLVESVALDSGETGSYVAQLQLLHQTVQEFVEEPQFKYRVLGQLTHITVDNGHTYWMKYMLCKETQITVDCLRHAYRSEKTTGVGLYDLLRGGMFRPPYDYSSYDSSFMFCPPTDDPSTYDFTAIEFAVAGTLHLTIKEALEQDGATVVRTSDRLLSIVMWSFDQDICDVDEAVGMIEFLVSCGCEMGEQASNLRNIIGPTIGASFYAKVGMENFNKMADAAIRGCHDPDTRKLPEPLPGPAGASSPVSGSSMVVYKPNSFLQRFGRLIGRKRLWSERDDAS